MKIFFLLIFTFLLLVNCGKKSEPKYQSFIAQEKVSI